MKKKIGEFPFKPIDIITIVLRRRWFIIPPIILSLIICIYLALTLPRIYEAKTLILIQPQQVPKAYINSVVTVDMTDMLGTIAEQLLNRTNLEKVIEHLDLFSEPKFEDLYLEDKVLKLRNSISLDTFSRRHGAFSISYRGNNPEEVALVANFLTSNFIEDNLKLREKQAVDTTTFLNQELKATRNRLHEIENQLNDYRRRHMGELPSQLSSNLQALERLQSQLNSKQMSLRDLNIELSRLAENKLIAASNKTTLRSEDVEDANDITQLYQKLSNLKMRYTDNHPDVIRVKKQIKELGSIPKGTPSKMNQISNDPTALRKAELNREKAAIEEEIVEINNDIAYYQRRVDNTPKREQELFAIERDYANIESSYNSLLARKLEAELSVNIEKKKKGEQFKILDMAREPRNPIKPDLPKTFLMLIAFGLGISGGITYLLEFLDTSFRKPDDIETKLELSVLGNIPNLITPKSKFIKRVNFLMSLTMIILASFLVGILGFILQKGTKQIESLIQILLA